MTNRSIQLCFTALTGSLLLSMTGCGIGTGSALQPVTNAPKRVRLDRPVIVDTGITDGRVYLPSGIYSAVGENEKGIYYAAPGGVGINLPLTTVSPFSVSSRNIGMRLPGGICAQPTGSGASAVRSYATWRAATWAPEKPTLLTPATPSVTFSLAR